MSDSIKATPWYDVECSRCSRWASSDFNMGMMPSRKAAVDAARKIGFRCVAGEQLCPRCALNSKLLVGKGQGNHHGKQTDRPDEEEQ